MCSRILIGLAIIVGLTIAYMLIMKRKIETFGSAGGSLIQLTASQVPGSQVFEPSPRFDQEVEDEINEMTDPAPNAVRGFSFGLVERTPFMPKLN